ncbi:SMC5-SMC6 complex localization factor protein 1 isoform X1 [Peromyscus maniculatus bairdii]|uniref:SMC5-SMC6 complex localization factor protein 1 n=1 Tax=Peromyscus maniculatus bairdii TaxID=230844 RepID=A0A8C8U5X8_PERMB|nr:SMC5-SMC6 complex localization factor protein 1 [Peromyscus maniculatus bairdii]XP_042117708.1 SMC5-SMC6 complex localization factor protein 1 [Peromyscus maniculatus bairdii]XP_042117709.1 SMC5-SMC6 complex localization factor protein 1 [Peromyscus maniculatus bairdii]XP_042117710.1 SMC5-SMC6 complex localization factor protein 1 [Peromyscus maniculatus bairdii]
MGDGATKHVIQMTGFKMEEKEALVKLLLKLDCTFIKSEKYKNCTHLIAERLCKSEKFLAACAAGKWVLTKDYIIHSAKSGRWLDETTYEWGYKIEKDSHYSPQMQSAPKRWREELKRTGAPGAFHRWKVVLLVRADKRSDSLVRVLEAGKANVILPKNSPSGITHVIASNARISAEQEQKNFKAPFYPIQYLGDFLLEKEIQNDEDSQTSSGWTKYNNQEKSKDLKKNTGFLEMKAAGERRIYRTQNKMENHDENVNDRFALSQHHKKEKFRDYRKDMKSVKKRNTFRRHTHENQKETKKKVKNIQRTYILRKKNKKEGYCKTDDEHDTLRSPFPKHGHGRDQKERKNSFLTDYASESKTKDVKTNVDLTEVKNALKKQIYRDIYRAQAVRYNCITIDKQPVYNVEVKNAELPRGILNLIESLIEGQFFKEAIEELSSLQAHYVPPVCLLHALLENVLQDSIDTFSGRYFHILSALLHLHPPWKSPAMLRYYLELFQCPACRGGAWSLVEVLIRSCLFNEGFCHQISENIGSKVVHLTLLKFFFNLLESEVRHLSQKLCDWSDSQSLKVTEKAILLEIFWSGSETSGLLTKPVNMLLEWTIYSHKEKCKSNDVFKHELAYLLTGILGAAIDYWIFLGIQMGRNVIRHMSDDLGSYISLSCDDFSSQELETLICSFSSSWLQMFVAEAIFKKLCLQGPASACAAPEPLSLQKIIDSYLPVLGEMDIHRAGKMQLPKKIGQRPCLESQRALLMLNGAKQKQVEGRPEFPELNRAKCSSSLKKLKKKSEGELSCSKENCPSLITKMNFHKTNLKGETALHRACIKNQVEKLIFLLSLPGIDINVKDNAGWTPLHEACNYGNTVCVQEILQRCPEVDLFTQVDGVTPLHDALSNGHVEIGKLLLQHGGPELLQQRNSKGELPLDYVLSPKDKEELFAITNIDDTLDNFHAQTQKRFYHQQLEFGSFLLSRMLLSFCSIFDLSSEFLLAFQGLAHLSELLTACSSHTEPPSAHADWLLDLYARNTETLKRLPDVLKGLPAKLSGSPGVHTEALLVTLEMMCRSVTEVS